MLSYHGFVFFSSGVVQFKHSHVNWANSITLTSSPLVARNLGLEWGADHTRLWDGTPVSAHREYIEIKCNWKAQLFNGSN